MAVIREDGGHCYFLHPISTSIRYKVILIPNDHRFKDQ